MSGDDDLLERATRALRDMPAPSEEELRIERAVLMRAQRNLATKRVGKSRALRWVLPLAAVLTAGTALAATGHMEVAVEAIVRMLAPERTKEEPAPAKKPRVRSREDVARKAPQPALPIDPAPSEPAAPEAPEAPSAPVPPAPVDEQKAPPPRRSAPRPAVPEDRARTAVAGEASEPAPAAPSGPSEAEATPAPNGDLMRYREAHQLHFRERDFWSALRAWESYLRTYPDGTFAVEARYNRAICLVRLGRRDEARRALTPFANGEVASGYRKTEAAELLEALE